MQERSGRQARRVTQRRNGRSESPGPASMQYASESISADERRRAQAAMIVLGLAFVAICVGYVVLAAGDILG